MLTSIENKQGILQKLHKRTTVDPTSGCWLWAGALNNVTHGHGIIKLWKFGKIFYVHRLSAYIHHDYDLNSATQVNHKCSNQNCWNPEHLYVGTQSQNLNDRYAGHEAKPDTWRRNNEVKSKLER